MLNNLNNEKDYVLLSGESKSWMDFHFHLKENQLIFFKEKFPISSFIISICTILFVGVISHFLGLISQKVFISNIFLIVVFLILIIFALKYNKNLELVKTTFNFEENLIIMKKYKKSILFSEVVEILFINGKIKGTEIAEIQLITHQETYLLASQYMDKSYFEIIPPEVLKKLESLFNLGRYSLHA